MNEGILGATIRSYRQRHRQIHNGKPWTLDDLAVATNDDKAHLSRIERGSILPNRSTLLRLARALHLTRLESEYLLRLAGFSPLYESPDQAAADAGIKWLARQTRHYLTPLTLYSIDMRVWYANALWLRLAGMTPARFRSCLQGKRLRPGVDDQCSTRQLLSMRYKNHDDVQRRSMIRLRTAVTEGHVPEEAVAELLQDRTLRAMWDAVESHLPYASQAGDQSSSEIAYPGRGVLRFDAWWCPLQIDRRFQVILHIPHDTHTRDALQAIRRDPRPEPGAPCPVHGYVHEGACATARATPQAARTHAAKPPAGKPRLLIA